MLKSVAVVAGEDSEWYSDSVRKAAVKGVACGCPLQRSERSKCDSFGVALNGMHRPEAARQLLAA
jgi:hypothetical protein